MAALGAQLSALRTWRFCLLLGLWFFLGPVQAENGQKANYLIGVGSHDMTGPAADVNLMGYANPEQNAAGIHMRLRARSFVVADPVNSKNRLLFVNLDACMGAQSVTLRTLSRLKARYGDLYTEKNVVISGTHTHSGPGGYLQYVLYIITSLGFVRQSFNAIVDGIEQSVIQAHENLRPGYLLINSGELLEANINRSPSAYLNNPSEEREKYAYDVDKTMTLLKFVDQEWGEVGTFNWFAVHGTSMNRTNTLISGDNKGAAARFMEDWYNKKYVKHFELLETERLDFAPDGLRSEAVYLEQRSVISNEYLKSSGGKQSTKLNSVLHRVRSPLKDSLKPPFVAAFCQSNVGDTTPNTQGAFCLDTGLACDFNHSTCNGQNELCIGRGPAYPADHFASTKIIAEKQFERAVELFESASEQITGKIQFKQTNVDFSNVVVKLENKQIVKTCPAAVGFSFAAGTTDGPGAFNFQQGDNQGNLFWKLVGGFLKTPSDEQIQCQSPKPILIDTGDMIAPYAWAPSILPISILKIGQFVILSVPAELTTMAGRRLREAVRSTLVEQLENGEDLHVVIAGLANGYSQYVATYEEYQVQRYEGASTLFGPHTLSAYIQEINKLAIALAQNYDVSPGPQPPDLVDRQLEFLPGVLMDTTPYGRKFGDLKEDVPVNATYKVGEVVEVVFYTGCPRNDLLTEGTYALVERLDSSGQWIPSYDDDDWSTRFYWYRPRMISPESYARISWEIPEMAQPGTYRIRHFGAYKHLFGSVKHFTGTSSAFSVSFA